MPERLGEAVLELSTDHSKLESGLSQAEGRTKRFAGAASLAGKAAAAAMVGVGVAAGAMAVGIAKGVVQAVAFEKQMSEVRTLLPNISDQSFGELNRDVLDFSRNMGIATSEVVPALYQAISAGIPRENAVSFLEQATKLSIGGVTDLTTATDVLTTAVNAYAESGLTAERASDILFTTVKNGKTTMDELGARLFNVLPIAASVGVTMEEVGAAMATMTLQGIPTAQATTQLRQVMVELIKPGADLQKVLEAVGITNAAAAIETDGLGGVLQKLQGYADENNVSLQQLFSSVEAGSGALAIMTQNGDAYARNLKEQENAAGATTAAYETMNQSLSRQWDILTNKVSTAVTNIGLRITPALRDMMPTMQNLVDKGIEVAEGIADAFVATADSIKTTASIMRGEVPTITDEVIQSGIGMEEVIASTATETERSKQAAQLSLWNLGQAMRELNVTWGEALLSMNGSTINWGELHDRIFYRTAEGIVNAHIVIIDAIKTMIDWLGQGIQKARDFMDHVSRARQNVTEHGGAFTFSGLQAGARSLFGFQSGGSFNVGGVGGADSQVVAFRATPGERVTVTPDQKTRVAPLAQGGDRSLNVNTTVLGSVINQDDLDDFIRKALVRHGQRGLRQVASGQPA